MIEQWRLACLRTLRAAFEPEAAEEFLRVSGAGIPRSPDTPTLRVHRRRVQEALALLQALNGTIKTHKETENPAR